MAQTNKGPKRLITAVFLLLVLCTFAARPIKTYNTATVTTVLAKSRRMEYTSAIQAELWYTNNIAVISVPFRLDVALQIASVYVSPLDEVRAGDPIVAFEPSIGEYALRQAETGLLSARIAYDAYLRQIEDAIARAKEDIRLLNIEASLQRKGERSVTNEKLRKLSAELEELESGESDERTLLEIRLNEERGRRDALLALSSAGWVLKSEYDGFAQDVRATTGGSYSGLDAIASVCQKAEEYTLLAPINKNWARIESDFGVKVTMQKHEESVTGEWRGLETRGGQLYARLRFASADAKGRIAPCTIELQAFDNQNVVALPVKALFDGNQVFVVGEREGYFGREYYVEQRTVQKGDSNGDAVGILSGVFSGDRVVIEADREIADGDTVLFSLR